MSSTKLKDIREYCKWCIKDNRDELNNCPSTNCPLHFYRFGKGNATKHPEGKPSLKCIREKCLDCSETSVEVRECEYTDCPLHSLRMGH